MGIKSWLIKKVVKENTYDLLVGIWEGIIKFVQHLSLYIKNKQRPKATSNTYTENEIEEKEMNKRYSKKGNQDADIWNVAKKQQI